MPELPPQISEKIKRFFALYENHFASGLEGDPDVEATAAAFADHFIEANPFGTSVGNNDEDFRSAIPQGYAFYKSIGTKSMKIAKLDSRILDDRHYMTKVHWVSLYADKQGKEERIDFDVIYFLQHISEELKIFAYITGDEQGALREHGLLPSQ